MSLELTLQAFEAQTKHSFQERAENISIADLLCLLDGANYTLSPTGKELVTALHIGYSPPKTEYAVCIVENELQLRRGTDVALFKDFRFRALYEDQLSRLRNEQAAHPTIDSDDFMMGM